MIYSQFTRITNNKSIHNLQPKTSNHATTS